MHDRAIRDGLKVVVFGSLGAAGQRLNNLTGIAAILRYEFVQLQDMVDGEDEGDLDSNEDEGEICVASDAGSTQAVNSAGQAISNNQSANDNNKNNL